MCRYCKQIWHFEEYRLFPKGMHKQLTNQFGTCGTHCSSHRDRTVTPSARTVAGKANIEEELSFACFSPFDSEPREALFPAKHPLHRGKRSQPSLDATQDQLCFASLYTPPCPRPPRH